MIVCYRERERRTASTTTTTVRGHLLELGRDVGLGLAQDGKELPGGLGVVGGEVREGRALHARALHDNVSDEIARDSDVKDIRRYDRYDGCNPRSYSGSRSSAHEW